MRIFVLGGSKGIGRLVAEKAMASGHEVTVMARHPSADRLEGVERVAGDATDPQPVHDALAGHDAVVIAIGAPLGDRTTRGIATANVVGGMQHHGVQRVVAVSSLGVGDSYGRMGFAGKAITRTLLRNAIQDHGKQEQELQRSGLSWTVVRPAGLTDGRTGHRVIDDAHSKLSAGRDDVADVVMKALVDEAWVGQAVAVVAAE